MKKWKAYVAGLAVTASLTGTLWAQAPAVPAAPGVPGVPGIGVPGVPAATPVGGLHAFLGLTPEAKDAKMRRLCSTMFGQMLVNMMKPVSVLSGGMFGNFCPGPSLADTMKPGPEGAANKIKKDEAEAKARRAAVRYLGTVDCHFWPEAEAALIGALRGDRNECVRFEAAMALGGGCCCTKKTIEALLISATGSDKDGNPSETCERVRAAAYASLQHCLSCFSEEVPANGVKPEKPEAPKEKPEKISSIDNGGIQLTAYYHKLEAKPMSQTIREARQAVSGGNLSFTDHHGLPSGMRGMANILSSGMGMLPYEEKTTTQSERPVTSTEMMTQQQMPMGSEVRIPDPMPVKTELFGPSTPVKPAVEIKPAVQQVPVKPVSMKPVESKPMAMSPTKPVETYHMTPAPAPVSKPAVAPPVPVSKPAAAAPAPVNKPVATMPAPKPVAAQPVETKPVALGPVEMKPAVKPIQTVSLTTKPVESKPVMVKPAETVAQPVSAKPAVQPVAMTTTPAPMPASMPTPSVTPRGNAVGPNPHQLLLVLRNSIYPFQREWAVDNLSNIDWRSNPEVVQALMSAARKDPAPTVRVMCIRSLVKMKVDTVPVVTTIQALRTDPDPRVEHEAQVALGQLTHVPQTGTAATPVAGTVQPVSGTATPASGNVVPAGWNSPGKTTSSYYGVGYPQ